MARHFGHHAPDLSADAGGAARGERVPSDPVALGELLAELEPRMRAVALRFTRDPAAAADVVQNAFEKVCRHQTRFRGDSRVSTWVHRIVANEALMWLRSERRRGETFVPPTSGLHVADPGASAEESLERRQERERVRRGLDRLSAEERDVLTRCALEGSSYEEYGRANGLHAAAVKSRAFRARRRLGDLLSSA